MKPAALAAAAVILAAAAEPAYAAGFRATVYFQVVRPAPELSADVDRWQPAVKSDLRRHIIDLVDDMNQRISDPASKIKLRFNREEDNFIRVRYQDGDFRNKSQEINSVQISVAESYKERGRTITRTDIYFGALRGDLSAEKMVILDERMLRNPSMTVSVLKYMFTYAWAMDFESNGKPLLSCPLLFKAMQLEALPDIRSTSGLGPLKQALRSSYARLRCQTELRGLNAH